MIQRHPTSFGIEACRLTMLLYILAIFRGLIPSGMSWGFWAVILIFWLSEKSSPYFRRQTAQLTVLLASCSVLDWLLALPGAVSTFRWFSSFNWASIYRMDAEDLPELFRHLFNSGALASGILSAVCSTLQTLLWILVTVLLIIGAVRAGSGKDWVIPGISKLAAWLDGKLHRGVRSF